MSNALTKQLESSDKRADNSWLTQPVSSAVNSARLGVMLKQLRRYRTAWLAEVLTGDKTYFWLKDGSVSSSRDSANSSANIDKNRDVEGRS